jgi:hypothetical protein
VEEHIAPRSGRAAVASYARAIVVGVAAWIVPGLGHALLRRWIPAVVFFAAVTGLAITGYMLHGYVFTRQSSGELSFLGYLADFGSGIFYFLRDRLEPAGPDVSRAAGDWGTRFLVAAGVANLLCVLDAVRCALADWPSQT